MSDADYLRDPGAIAAMARGRRETRLQAFAASFVVTTEMGADAEHRLGPILEVRAEQVGNPSAVLHMFEAALELAVPPDAQWMIKRYHSSVYLDTAEWGLKAATRALATLEGIVRGATVSRFQAGTHDTSTGAKRPSPPLLFVSDGRLIAPRDAICILFGGYVVTHKGVIMNNERQLVPIVQLKMQVPKEARAHAAMEHLFEAMFEALPMRQEGFLIRREYKEGGVKLSAQLHQGTPREAVEVLEVLSGCV